MKKIIPIVMLMFLLTGCGTGSSNGGTSETESSEDATTTSESGTDESETETTTEETTTTVSTTTTPEPLTEDRFSLYQEYFSDNYGGDDLVHLADVTHDGADEMIVISTEDGYSFQGIVYTVQNNKVVQLYEKGGGTDHDGGYFNWYLVKDGSYWDLAEEYFDMWQGHGEDGFRVYYISEFGEQKITNHIYTPEKASDCDADGKITDVAFTSYVNKLNDQIKNAYVLFSCYSEASAAPKTTDTDPISVLGLEFSVSSTTTTTDTTGSTTSESSTTTTTIITELPEPPVSELEAIAEDLYVNNGLAVISCYTYLDWEIDYSDSIVVDGWAYYSRIKGINSKQEALAYIHKTFSARYDDYNRGQTSGDPREEGACAVTNCLSDTRDVVLFKEQDGKLYVFCGDSSYSLDSATATYQKTDGDEVWFTMTVSNWASGPFTADFSLVKEDGVWKIGAATYPRY